MLMRQREPGLNDHKGAVYRQSFHVLQKKKNSEFFVLENISVRQNKFDLPLKAFYVFGLQVNGRWKVLVRPLTLPPLDKIKALQQRNS